MCSQCESLRREIADMKRSRNSTINNLHIAGRYAISHVGSCNYPEREAEALHNFTNVVNEELKGNTNV